MITELKREPALHLWPLIDGESQRHRTQLSRTDSRIPSEIAEARNPAFGSCVIGDIQQLHHCLKSKRYRRYSAASRLHEEIPRRWSYVCQRVDYMHTLIKPIPVREFALHLCHYVDLWANDLWAKFMFKTLTSIPRQPRHGRQKIMPILTINYVARNLMLGGWMSHRTSSLVSHYPPYASDLLISLRTWKNPCTRWLSDFKPICPICCATSAGR